MTMRFDLNTLEFNNVSEVKHILRVSTMSLFSAICRVSVPETWTRYTEENIRRALSEIAQSDELLNSGNQLMATANNDMWSQWNQVNVSLENRVQEEQVAKNKTQAHLEKVTVRSIFRGTTSLAI